MASVLFVAYHFAPENTSGTHRSLHFARALVDAGHDVTVISGPQPPASRSDPELQRVFPWPDRVHRVASPTSVGSVYVSLKRQLRTSRASGAVAVQSVAPAASAQTGIMSRLRHHLRAWEALPDHQRSWRGPAVALGRTLGRQMRADAVFASGPPWTGVMTGHQIARALGVPFIADFRDPWTTVSGATWRYSTDWAQARAERWDAQVLADAAIVCFNSQRLSAIVDARNSLGTRSRVILNGSDVTRQTEAVPFPTTGPLRLRHFGSLYVGRTVTPLVHALDELISAGRLRPDEVELELIGDAEPSSAGHSELLKSRVPIRFTPQITFAEASQRMSEPGILLCVQTAQHASLIPTKLYDYLCTGNPIVVLSPHASASWDVASAYTRSHRLDLEATERNREIVASLFDTWRRGELRREVSVKDTEALGKKPIGLQFVQLVEELVGQGRSLNHRNGNG